MPVYLNLTTNEYPRFPGDVEISPDDEWVLVHETEQPSVADAGEGNCWVEDEPQCVNGVWHQRWKTIPKPVDLRQIEIQKALDAGIDLALLGVRI